MVAASADVAKVAEFNPVGGNLEFYGATDPEVLAVGPAGTGKTMAAVWKLHDVAMGVPGVRILMARKVLEDLKTGALATYTNHVKPELDGVITFGGNRFYPGEFRYPNGSVIHVVGMDKPGKVMSAEYDIIFVNEATEISEEILQALKSRLRNGVLGYQQLIMDCNPSGPRHWLNKRCNAGTTRRIVTTHKDNPAYWDADRQEWTEMGRMYVQDTLGSLTGIERERLFLGKWAAAEGLVYPEFNPDIHEKVIDTDGWRCVLGVDVGTNNPTAILVAFVAGDGRIHIADELYQRGLGTKGIIDAIKGYADEYQPDAVYVDPSAKAYITDLHALGIPAVGANNDVLTGIQRVRSVFQTGFSVDPRCINLIDEFGMYAYPSNAKAETDKPAKEHDHACFVAGTMVTTIHGERPIESVAPGDLVLTRNGYEPVVAAGMTAQSAEVLTVYLSNGKSLTGTANHPVWANGRWVPLDALRYGDMLSTVTSAVPSLKTSHSATIPASAPTNASRHGVVNPALMTKTERVSSVATSIEPTGTAVAKHVPVYVERVVKSSLKQDVYNLTVANTPEYFAQGVMVHNCDALRYLCMGAAEPVINLMDFYS